MEIKPGYKQAEIGVIPEEWDVVAIRDLNPFVTSGSRGWAAFYSERGSPFIRITNLSRESIDLDLGDMKYVNLPKISAEGVRTQLQDHDVLISITADIGIIGYVSSKIPKPAYINQHIALVRFVQDSMNSRFISYYLASKGPQKLFLASTDTGAKAGMSLITVKKIRLALPPLLEQNLIANALSDMDALIATLDQLIAKKRLIKQSATKQLLTGNTRLPGFGEKWASYKLGDVADIFKGSGLSKAKVIDNGRRKCILYGELFTTYGRVIREVVSSTNTSEGVVSMKGDVLLPGSTTTIGIDLAIASALMLANVTLGGDINVIRQKKIDTFSPVFLANYLTYVIRNAIAEIAQGITIIHLYGKDLRELSIKLPTIEEQEAIASIISDFDDEIVALRKRRDKTLLLKQGMMQELLTGKTRLI